MRYRFNQIFTENPNGSLTPTTNIKIGPATLGQSVTFSNGASFGGVNIFDFKDLDIEADEENGILIINGFYR